MAWTYPSEFVNLISCVVKGLLALRSVRSGGFDAWESGDRGFHSEKDRGLFF